MEPLLELKNVTKKYEKFTLNDVSFSVMPGQIVGFIGRNGAGKTTTLKGIMSLIKLDGGEIYAFGNPMKGHELEAKQDIGFSLSEMSYYPDKKIKDIMSVTKVFYKKFSEERFLKLCDHFNLDINKKIRELSTGMKVKYSLAIALSYDAKLLILDEPTSGLDPISRDEILDIFESIVKDKSRAILFSTHITSDLEKCATDIVYIHDGEIKYTGKKENYSDRYSLIITNNESLLEKYAAKAISFKKNEKEIEILISKEDLPLFKKEKVEIKKCDLETTMVMLERGKDHEEFVL